VLKISYGTVYQWVKKYGEKKELPQKKEPVKIVELDEMHTCAGQKKLPMDKDCC
jgi:transposase